MANVETFVLGSDACEKINSFFKDDKKVYGGILVRFASNTYDNFCICTCGHNQRQNEAVCPKCGALLKSFNVTRKTKSNVYTRNWMYVPTSTGGSLVISNFVIASKKSGSVYDIQIDIENELYGEMWMNGSKLEMKFAKLRYGSNGTIDGLLRAITDWMADSRFEFVYQVAQIFQYVSLRKETSSYTLMSAIGDRLEMVTACSNTSPALLTRKVMDDNLPVLESMIKAGATKHYSSVEGVYKGWKIHEGMWPYVRVFFSDTVLKDSEAIALRNSLTNGTVSNGQFLLQALRRGIVSYENIISLLTERKRIYEEYGEEYLPLFDSFISKNVHKVPLFNSWGTRIMRFTERVVFLRKNGIIPTDETLDDRYFYPAYNKYHMCFKASVKDIDNWEKEFMKDPLEVMGLVHHR